MPSIAIRNHAGLVIARTLVDQGDLLSLSQWRWCLLSKGYVGRKERIDGRSYSVRMHRLLLGLKRGDPRQGDHINGDVLDNRRSNLRVVDCSGNSQNKRSYRGSSSRFRGVAKMKNGKFRANVRVGGELLYLGEYVDEREAARVAAEHRAIHLPFAVETRHPV